jgi:hypothetical protein
MILLAVEAIGSWKARETVTPTISMWSRGTSSKKTSKNCRT